MIGKMAKKKTLVLHKLIKKNTLKVIFEETLYSNTIFTVLTYFISF
jgi:hypothetical protein